MNIPPKYEDVVAECAALKEEIVHMTALRDTWYEQYQELKSSRQQRLTFAEQRAGELDAVVQSATRLLNDSKANLNQTGRLAKEIRVFLDSRHKANRLMKKAALKPAEEVKP